MRRTFLVSGLTAMVVMAIALLVVPRLGTVIAGPDSPNGATVSGGVDIAPILDKARKAAAFAAAHPRLFNSSSVTAVTAPATKAPEGSDGCCMVWQGFNVTSTLVAPTNATHNLIPCVNCLPGAAANHLAVPFPEGRAFIGGNWSTLVTFHSTIVGPCDIFFGWFSIPFGQFVAGNSTHINDCGGNNIWVIDFFNNTVPNTPGDTVAVGVIQSAAGPVDVDYMQFAIQ